MATLTNVVKSPIQNKIGSLNYSSGYEYRDFWYTNASGQRIHVIGWHKAIDITTLGTIVAFEKGKIIALQKGITGQTTNPSSGNSVTLEHANGTRTIYCHLDNGSNNHLSIGGIVEAGAKLGTDTIKTTGNSTGLHLHFGIYVGGDYVDPVPYLKGTKTLQPYGSANTTITPPVNTGEIIHTVMAGDTLWAIAKKYLGDGNRYPEIAKYNSIANPNIIKTGQRIIIPSENTRTQTANNLLDLVQKTIRGDFGNGEARKKTLGSNYAEVQKQVNLNINAGLTRWDNIKIF